MFVKMFCLTMHAASTIQGIFFNYIVCFYIFFFPLAPTDTNVLKVAYKLDPNLDKITRKSPSVDSVVRSMAHGLYENSVDRIHMKYLLSLY